MPSQRPPKNILDLGKTVGLLLRLKKPLWHTAKLVILDSGLCVLKGIVNFQKKGVFASALIKNCRYWPRFIKGDDVKEHLAYFEVGAVDAWPGHLDGVKFYVSCMKEPEYAMSLMTTYGTTELICNSRPRVYEINGIK